MHVIKSIHSIQKVIRHVKLQNKKVGFVPTMGALHEGHLSLIRKCRRENDLTVLSIFVNPKQFGPQEDFSSYPRPHKKDIFLAKKEKVDIIFYPSVEEMYPPRYLTYIHVEKMTDPLCGESRPGHFKGVATIVGKLLNIVMPDILYLGQKDAQQAVVLKKMAEDLNWPVTVKICPTVREKDGLAMSSRNKYLSSKQRQEAPILFYSLKEAKKRISLGERKVNKIIATIRSIITKNSSAKIDYVECVHARTLEPLKHLKGMVLIALAVKFGKTRLIDNIVILIK